MRKMLLECHNINFSYPATQDLVFKGLNLQLAAPGFHALFGPSGIGKTSLAKILTGEFKVNSGEVRTTGLSNKILYTHNLERLPGWSSIGRHLERVTPLYHNELKSELIQSFGMNDLLKKRFGQLSLGQQNRINLIRYLVQDFKLLIMDESLANVDEHTRERILLTIKKIFPSALFLYISHNLVEVAKFCRYIWVLRAKRHLPQATVIDGRDHSLDNPVDKTALESTMLEIMNAS